MRIVQPHHQHRGERSRGSKTNARVQSRRCHLTVKSATTVALLSSLGLAGAVGGDWVGGGGGGGEPTLQSWKCSDWRVSWTASFSLGAPGGAVAEEEEEEEEAAVKPSSTFLMLNFFIFLRCGRDG